MAEYKDVHNIIREVLSVTLATDNLFGLGIKKGIDLAIDAITKEPAADVAEVKHGEWIGKCGTGLYDDYYCSVCGMYEKGTRNRNWLGNYCPNCGAKMTE